MDTRVAALDEKIRKLDIELNGYKEKMKKTREGTALHTQLKQKALRVLKQKKMYEGQRDQIMNQQFNIEQASFATQTMKDTVTTVSAMKSANLSLKDQLKHISVDDIDVSYFNFIIILS
jgi:charged multivesicular body protein 5